MSNNTTDPYVGSQPRPNYTLTKWVGKGRIGDVYKAIRTNSSHVLACKVIRPENLKDGWERELEKVIKLTNGSTPCVVQYQDHGASRQTGSNEKPLFSFVGGGSPAVVNFPTAGNTVSDCKIIRYMK